jgi:hypothetical protein
MEDLHGLAISSFQPEIVASAIRVKLAIGAAAPESMLISLLPPFCHAPTIPSLGCNRGASRISPDMQNLTVLVPITFRQAVHLVLRRNLATTCLLKDLRCGMVILDSWARIGKDFDETCKQWMETQFRRG